MTIPEATLHVLFPDLQQGVLFPTLVDASFLPLEQYQSSRESALHDGQQDLHVPASQPKELEGQLTLWTL